MSLLDRLAERHRGHIEADPYLRAVAEAATAYRISMRKGSAIVDERAAEFVSGLHEHPLVREEIGSGVHPAFVRDLKDEMIDTWGRAAGVALAGALSDPLDLLFVRESQARKAGNSQVWIDRARSHRLNVFPDPSHPLPPLDEQEVKKQAFWSTLIHEQTAAEAFSSRPKLSDVAELEIYDHAVASSGYDPGWVDDAKRAELSNNGPQLP